MIKQAISAFAAAAVAVSFASVAFAENASVIEKIPVTDFDLIDNAKEGAVIDSDNQKITLTYLSAGQKKGNSWTNLDNGDYDAESYIKYTATANGTVSITFSGDNASNANKPRLYYSVNNDGKPYNKQTIASDSTKGYKQDTTGANAESVLSFDVTKGETYFVFGYLWFGNNTRTTFTLTDFKFTSTADITAAEEYIPKEEYDGPNKGFTAKLTGSGSGTINWYAKSKDAEAYSKIGSVSTVLTGEDSTDFTAGLVISGIDGNDFNYEIGASIN